MLLSPTKYVPCQHCEEQLTIPAFSAVLAGLFAVFIAVYAKSLETGMMILVIILGVIGYLLIQAFLVPLVGLTKKRKRK
jgi:lipopolysaccharide export LptBFGC system permease protein LptF